MAKNPNKNPKRTYYRKPTKAATKAEEAKQNNRILRYRAKLEKEAKEKMVKFMGKEKAKMVTFKKGKKTTKPPAKKSNKSARTSFLRSKAPMPKSSFLKSLFDGDF